MNRWILLFTTLVALGVGSPLSAQSLGTLRAIYTTVDQFTVDYSVSTGGDRRAYLHVHGVQVGASGPALDTFSVYDAPSCERMLGLLMERPGRYRFVLRSTYHGGSYLACGLTRAP
jgi:hypothetical protein